MIVMRYLAAGMVSAALLPCAVAAADPVFQGPVPRAQCGAGSLPETGLQGEVPIKDRDNGRSDQGYRCNLEQVGNYPGEGAEWQDTWYRNCAYYDTRLSGTQQSRGTQVIDVSDPAHPKFSTNLTSPAMIDPWESLSVNEKRGLLAGVAVDDAQGAAFFDVYDVSKDCAHPEMKASLPVNILGHEGDWAPDGQTYYGTGIAPGVVTAIDLSDPSQPTPITAFNVSSSIHGISVSDDGKRLYVADISGQPGVGNGLTIIDVSDIQARNPAPQTKVIGTVGWTDGSTAQSSIPVTIDGHPYLIFFDELGAGAARIIDLADETHPKVISKLKLEIHMPENKDRAAESAGVGRGSSDPLAGFGYNAHYCGVPQRIEPGVVGCSEFESGVRIFDIRDPYHPREIAYFNPGGNGGKPVPGSFANGGKAGYTSARVRFIKDSGEIWFTDQDKGFYVARFTNGVWPFLESGQTGTAPDLGLPPARQCASRRSFRIRLRVPRGDRLRSARVYVNGKRVRVVSGRRLRAPVDLRGLPRGTVRVKIVARTRGGRKVTRTRTYHPCVAKRPRSKRKARGTSHG